MDPRPNQHQLSLSGLPENKHTIHFSLALVKLLEPNFQTSEAFENQKGKAAEGLNFRVYAEANDPQLALTW